MGDSRDINAMFKTKYSRMCKKIAIKEQQLLLLALIMTYCNTLWFLCWSPSKHCLTVSGGDRVHKDMEMLHEGQWMPKTGIKYIPDTYIY